MVIFFNSLEPSISHQWWFKRFWMLNVHICMDVRCFGFESDIYTCICIFLLNQWRKTQWCHCNRAIMSCHLQEHVCTLLPVALSIFWIPFLILALYKPMINNEYHAAGQPYVHCLKENWGYVLLCSLHVMPCYCFSFKHLGFWAYLGQCAD